MVWIETECGANIFGGFYSSGECDEVIRFELEGSFREAADEYDFQVCEPSDPERHGQRAQEDDEFTICFGVECPRCGTTLEWPQVWRASEEE